MESVLSLVKRKCARPSQQILPQHTVLQTHSELHHYFPAFQMNSAATWHRHKGSTHIKTVDMA